MKIKLVLGLIFGLVIIFLLIQGFLPKSSSPAPSTNPQLPTISSTSPSPLEGALVTPTQEIRVNFSSSLENLPEFRYKMDPTIDLEVKLSEDRKTVTFKPKKYYDLSTAYTLFIYKESKFDGKKTLDKDYIFHFHTPNYTGV